MERMRVGTGREPESSVMGWDILCFLHWGVVEDWLVAIKSSGFLFHRVQPGLPVTSGIAINV